MKIKHLMIVCLILAIVTIGAVSAADDAVSDDLAASDEGDAVDVSQDDDLGEMDEEDVDIYVDEDVSKADTGENFTDVSVTDKEGNFVISTGEGENAVELYREDLSTSGRGIYDEEDESYHYGVSLDDINGYIADKIDPSKNFYDLVSPQQIVKFVFEYRGTNLVEDSYIVDFNEENITFQEAGNQGENDVYIEVDEEHGFNLTTISTMPFAFVSVPDGIQGNITIAVYEDEEPIYFFNRNLTDIEKHMADSSREGYTQYWIALSDLDNLDDFLENKRFEIALIDDDYEIESQDFGMAIKDDVVSFYKIVPKEGNGTEIDATFAEEANAVTDDVIAFISKDELLDVDDEFEVTVKYDDEGDEDTIPLDLTEIESDERGYYIQVSDLFDIDGIFEELEIDLLIQFFKDGTPVCYAETEEGILVYINPCIHDVANTIMDDEVISFTPIDGADDEFNVTISKQGSADVVKTFKTSELNDTSEDDEGPAYYVLKLSDLGITEGGNYTISVNFTKDGKELIFYSANVSVSDELQIYIMVDKDAPESIADSIFIIRVPEEMKGYVKVYVDDVQVGGNISFDKLNYCLGPMGRDVWLNNFNITETGNYDLKVDVFDESGQFLGNASVNIPVEVGVNTATFNDVYYAQGGYIAFNLTSPISENAYFIIYLNGKKAGVFHGNVYADIEFYDEFVDTLGYGEYDRFLKLGDYDANVTFFDGASENDFATGSFSVKSMNITTDKEKYLEKDNVTISFKADEPTEYSHLSVSLITGWGPMGPDDHRIFAISSEDVVKAWKDGVITVNIGNLALGANNLLIEYLVAENKDDWDNDEYIVCANDLITVNVVEPVDPALTIAVANIEEGNPASVTITTNATFTGIVVVKIANKEYNVTVTNGKGTLSVPGLAANTYTATAVFAATGLFAASEKTAKFTVTKKAAPAQKITLTLKKVKVKKSAKKLVLQATLKINGKAVKGKVIKFKFNKKTYKAKTNKKGVAKVTIKKKILKKLKVGKKVKYQATYGKVTKKYTVKVKK